MTATSTEGQRFEVDALLASAMAATGRDDMGEPAWREGLERLLDDLEGSARLNELGRTIVETEVAGYLSNRMEILAWRRDHPEVAEGAVTRPIVIVGQPRTGTTILYDLLAQDPANRAPLTWEVDSPCPPPESATYDTDPRIDEAEAIAAMPDLIIPGFTDFHPLGARLAQECVRMTGGDFRSMIFPTQYDVPEYNRWLLHEADMSSAYRWHHIYLQHLQSRHAGDRWLLKSPGHMWSLGALLDEYPDALIVQTHRDPVRVIASISALVALLRSMASDNRLYVGRPGTYGERAANFAIQNADAMITVGCRLATALVGHDLKNFAKTARKVIVDIDTEELYKPGFDDALKIQCDAKVFLQNLNRASAKLSKM